MEEQGTAAKTALVVDTRETGQLTVDTSDEGRGIRIELVITTNKCQWSEMFCCRISLNSKSL